jgi:hypothetical protein
MPRDEIATGVVHEVPDDVRGALKRAPRVREAWNKLTPLARNEWLCYVTIVRKPETRKAHVERLCQDLLDGKRRPCCWPGCPHRRPSARKWFRDSSLGRSKR